MFLKRSRQDKRVLQQKKKEQNKEPKFSWLLHNKDELTLDEVTDIENLLEDDE